MKVEVCKPSGIRRELEKGTCPLCMENEDVKTYTVELPRNQKMENAIY
jgi:hypothetical protein